MTARDAKLIMAGGAKVGNNSDKMIRARVTLPNLPTFALDIPMRSGNEAFGFLAAFIAHIEGVECPVRQAYRAMGAEDHRLDSDREIGKRG